MKIVYETYKIKTYSALYSGLDMALYQNHALFEQILSKLF